MAKNRILMEIWYTKQNTKNTKYMHGAAPPATHVMLVGSGIINTNLVPPTPSVHGAMLATPDPMLTACKRQKGEVIEPSI